MSKKYHPVVTLIAIAVAVVAVLAFAMTQSRGQPTFPIPGSRLSGLAWLLFSQTGTIDLREIIKVTGENPSVANNVDETIWSFGGIRPEISSVQCPLGDGSCVLTMTVISTSDDDDIAGIGARTVRIRGIDIDGFQFFETVDMNGTTGVTMTTPMRAILPIGVFSVGSSNAQVGVITLENAATVYEVISIDGGPSESKFGGSHTAGFDVPLGFVMYLERASWSTDDNFHIVFESYIPVIGPRSFPIDIREQSVLPIGLCYPQRSRIRVIGNSTNGTAPIAVTFNALLFRKESGQCAVPNFL